MYRAPLVGNRICNKKWEDRCHEIHMKKLRTMKARVDNKQPPKYVHLIQNLKKQQLEDERYSAIERENYLLLDKMSHIMTHQQSTMERPFQPATKSLNKEARKRELMRITEENQAILKRIQHKEPFYNHLDWEYDRKVQEGYLRNICEYPYTLVDGVMYDEEGNEYYPEDGQGNGEAYTGQPNLEQYMAENNFDSPQPAAAAAPAPAAAATQPQKEKAAPKAKAKAAAKPSNAASTKKTTAKKAASQNNASTSSAAATSSGNSALKADLLASLAEFDGQPAAKNQPVDQIITENEIASPEPSEQPAASTAASTSEAEPAAPAPSTTATTTTTTTTTEADAKASDAVTSEYSTDNFESSSAVDTPAPSEAPAQQADTTTSTTTTAEPAVAAADTAADPALAADTATVTADAAAASTTAAADPLNSTIASSAVGETSYGGDEFEEDESILGSSVKPAAETSTTDTAAAATATATAAAAPASAISGEEYSQSDFETE